MIKKKNFSSVLAFGGSTVVGEELDDDINARMRLAFPALVAKALDVPCYNHAWSGGSNQRSLRILPEVILDHPNSLVLFTWVNFNRNEFFLSDDSYNGPISPEAPYVPLGINWLTLSGNHRLKKYIELWYKHFYNDPVHHNNYREYNALFYVDSVCRQYATDYVQILEIPNLLPNYATNTQQQVWEKIDKTKILKFPETIWSENGYNNGYGNFYEWAEKQNFPMGKSHVLHQAHQSLAQLILDKIIQ